MTEQLVSLVVEFIDRGLRIIPVAKVVEVAPGIVSARRFVTCGNSRKSGQGCWGLPVAVFPILLDMMRHRPSSGSQNRYP